MTDKEQPARSVGSSSEGGSKNEWEILGFVMRIGNGGCGLDQAAKTVKQDWWAFFKDDGGNIVLRLFLLGSGEQLFYALLDGSSCSDFVQWLMLLVDIVVVLVIDMDIGSFNISKTW